MKPLSVNKNGKHFHFTTPVMGSRGVCLLLLGCGGLLQTSFTVHCACFVDLVGEFCSGPVIRKSPLCV